MFKEMRRKEKEASNETVEKIMTEGEYGILATVGEDNYPYTTPINYVYSDGAIYLHGALEGHKYDNIKHNNKVSFCVVGRTNLLPGKFTSEYESVVIFGRAEFPTGQEKTKGLKALLEKYSPDFMQEGLEYIDRALDKTAVIKITIDHITGKKNYS
ncbi:MAG: pyridoxamine 5'-phosphate oxidase family protein [Halanaerobiales bacterium]